MIFLSRIYIFRGKAATGKTLITDTLSKNINVPVLRKDDIYDKLAIHYSNSSELNRATFDILIGIIQTNIKTNCDMIIDVGLAHNPNFEQFILNIDLSSCVVSQFLCTCSNTLEWRKRIELRLTNPMPNQFFVSAEEADRYYNTCSISPFKGEVLLDSSQDISILMDKVYKKLTEM